MTAARSTKIDLSATPYYHCMTRCVRRSFLCGVDLESGHDYSHRKGWIVDRMKQLAEIFAINICAYAVMSNHYHLVLFIDEQKANQWQDDEVFQRWERLFPNDANQIELLGYSKLETKQKIALWRQRLASISWFMRCLNETIARLSNKEDALTGRFWEGRFKSQALLDEGALLAAMAYVDLNPIRAKAASTPETSAFTSIYERIQMVAKQLKNKTIKTTTYHEPTFAKRCDNTKQPQSLMAFGNDKEPTLSSIHTIDFRLSDYLHLIDETGRFLREDKRGAIPQQLSPILSRLHLSVSGWLLMVKNLEKHFFHAIGNTLVLADFGLVSRERKPKGMYTAKKCYLRIA
jgi:REP element-mobilizing transposase RayT